VRDAGNIQHEVGLVGGSEHPMFLVLGVAKRRLLQIGVDESVSRSAKRTC